MVLLAIPVSVFAQKSFTWTGIGSGDQPWNDASNWFPSDSGSPGVQDEAIVIGVTGSGTRLSPAVVTAAADVGSLNAMSGGQIKLNWGLTVHDSSSFQGYADYQPQISSKAQPAALAGTNTIRFMAGDHFFGRWVQVLSPVENFGNVTISHLGEFFGSTGKPKWFNRAGARLAIYYPTQAVFQNGVPGGPSGAGYGVLFSHILNDQGGEVDISIYPGLSSGFAFVFHKNEGVVRVTNGYAILLGETWGGRLEIASNAHAALGRSSDVPGGQSGVLYIQAGARIVGAGSLGFSSGQQWNFLGPFTFETFITNRTVSGFPMGIAGAAVNFSRGGFFRNGISFAPQIGGGATLFSGSNRVENTFSTQRDLDNFGTLAFSPSSSIEATGGNAIMLRNHPGARLTVAPDVNSGTLGYRAFTETAGGQGTFLNLPGATLWYQAPVDSSAFLSHDWSFVNDGYLRVDGGFLRFRDQFAQGPAGILQLDAGGGATLYKTTNMAGRIMGSGTLTATNLVFGGELSPHGDLDAGGISAGRLLLAGSFGLNGSSRTRIDIAGRPAQTNLWDQLLVTGNITLGGTLLIYCTNGLSPAPEDSWRVVSVSGQKLAQFDEVHFANLPAGHTGMIVSDGTSVSVQFVAGDLVNYSGWKGSNTFPNPAASERGEDPDEDGLINAVEYATGLDPMVPNVSPFSIAHSDPNGANEMILSFRRPAGPNKPGDAHWLYATSTNLTDWTPLSSAEEVGPMQPDGFESVSVRLPVASSTATFLKVAVEID